MEIRFFTMVVSLIDDKDEDFKQYEIPIKNLINLYDIKSKTIYAEMDKLSTSMLKKIITIPLKENDIDKELKTTLFGSFKYAKNGSGMLEVNFNPVLKPFLLQLKNRFLLYDIKNILKLTSSNSIKMYELLKSYE
ncbi:replication initiation protein [Chryseobacterium sp. SL1]|uniref:replication initiation protein n=1 Tax=Chryseobacterium sp. SL1 TaxID=2995159 RepID=UPI002DD44F69|nr:replication initiation protein [Chryseobacterium sp. SL1]